MRRRLNHKKVSVAGIQMDLEDRLTTAENVEISSLTRTRAIAEGLVANLIWASSFVLVKIALEEIGPLTAAGMRFFSAFLILFPFMLRSKNIVLPRSGRVWLRLFLIGLSSYTIGNGALFWGLIYLPAVTASFLMSLLPLMIMFAGSVWLRETPSRWQIMGVFVGLSGSALFFSPGLEAGEPLGVALVGVALIAFMIFGILGREIARDRVVDTLTLTAIPLAFGGGLLLLIGLIVEGLPSFSPITWLIILWLALINTAFAYFIYNRSLQFLTALEMNVLLNLLPFATALLAWILLGETLIFIQILGMIVVVTGVIFVQARSI
ncbi:MAG: EamA family transporter [Anaerolineales bacterium]|nr:EamA family transporter [Anaerolineales bacterium]